MLVRRPLILVAVLAAAVMIPGCGAGDVIDPKKTELALQFDVKEATGTEVDSVACPSDVPASVGTRFTCHVVAGSGDEAVAELEVTSEAGDLRVLSLEAP